MSFIKRIVRSLQNKKEKRRTLKQMAQQISRFMIPGWYHMEHMYGKAVLKAGVFPERITPKGLVRIILFGLFRIRNNDPAARCSAALCSPFGNHKLFDRENAKVYTVFADPYWENASRFCREMQPCFRTEILSADSDGHVLVENYLLNTVKPDPKACFEYFCEEYGRYLADRKAGASTISLSYVKEVLDAADLPADVRQYISHIESRLGDHDVSYPAITCHNDINVKNILTSDNESFSLIDFECCGENVFFFDFMGLIFNSAVFKDEPALYQEYRAGALDGQLEHLFRLCGAAYHPDSKEFYLYLFLLFKFHMIYCNFPDLLTTYSGRVWRFLKHNELL